MERSPPGGSCGGCGGCHGAHDSSDLPDLDRSSPVRVDSSVVMSDDLAGV